VSAGEPSNRQTEEEDDHEDQNERGIGITGHPADRHFVEIVQSKRRSDNDKEADRAQAKGLSAPSSCLDLRINGGLVICHAAWPPPRSPS
jgi:hypothetical protein